MAYTIHVYQTSVDVHVLAGAREDHSMHFTFLIKKTVGYVQAGHVYETHYLVRIELPPAVFSVHKEFKKV